MIILKDTDSLRVFLAGAVATNQLPCFVSYLDVDPTTRAITGSGNKKINTNGTTPVAICDAPASGFQRYVVELNIRQKDTASVTLTLELLETATRWELDKSILAVDDTYQWDEK